MIGRTRATCLAAACNDAELNILNSQPEVMILDLSKGRPSGIPDRIPIVDSRLILIQGRIWGISTNISIAASVWADEKIQTAIIPLADHCIANPAGYVIRVMTDL